MGDKSKIEWTEATWNPVIGCSKVSPGCDNCYAIDQAMRIQRMGGKGGATYEGTTVDGDWSGLVRCLPERLDQPLRWKRPRRVFVNSMSDLFHPDVPDGFIGDVWNTMALAPQHTFQILTKRPKRMQQLLSKWAADGWSWRRSDLHWCGPVNGPLPNVWLGVSIESNRYAWRADHLRDTPAAVRWVSAEPLLGPLDQLDLTGIDWLVVGGESGPNARPADPEWVRDLRDRCMQTGCDVCGDRKGGDIGYDREGMPSDRVSPCVCDKTPAGTAFLFKQWGGRTSKSGGRELDGRTWDEYPKEQP